MERLGTKLMRVGRADGYSVDGQIAHWCPACEELHPFAVAVPNRSKAKWSFDGNVERPTFSPSMNIRTGPFPDGHMEICHYFLTRGELRFRPDSTHGLKGQTVPLPDLPTRYLEPESPPMPPRNVVAPKSQPTQQPVRPPEQTANVPGQSEAPNPNGADNGSNQPETETETKSAGTVADDFAALRTDLIALADRVAGIEGGAGEKSAAVDALKQAIEGLERRFAALETAVQRRNTAPARAAAPAAAPSPPPAFTELLQRVTRIEAQIKHMV
jgi:hypothetical protein